MTPKLRLLDSELLERILGEAFDLLMSPGVRVDSAAAVQLLQSAGATVEHGIAHIPGSLARACLASAPREFGLFDRRGNLAIRYGGDHVQFDPGSCCVQVLDAETQQVRPSRTSDLVRIVRVAEMLPQFAAQATAVVCSDAPAEIGDLYRLYVVLQHSHKPIVTGAFTARTLGGMLDLLAADAGGSHHLRQRPRAVFDVCPSPPLTWSEFAAHNLVDLACAGVPAQIVSMPLAGAAAPVTLAGSVVQHAAETISGITIHQLAAPGAPLVWGGAPAIFDMRRGTTPMGAIETAMLNMACAEVGKYFSLPTHAYLVASDSKLVDAQAGMESAVSAVLGALAGINMISGAGMLESLACHSVEKLAIDAEAVAAAQRLRQGIEPRRESLATAMFARLGLRGDFLTLEETRALFRLEQYMPSSVIDRSPRGDVQAPDMLARARARVNELLEAYQPPALPHELIREFDELVEREATRAGLQPGAWKAERVPS